MTRDEYWTLIRAIEELVEEKTGEPADIKSRYDNGNVEIRIFV